MARNQSFYEYLTERAAGNSGKVIGVLLALVAVLLIILVGFWKTVFLVILILIGYLIGKSYDDRVSLGELWTRMFGKR
jgi:uncharacterized membrane protein